MKGSVLVLLFLFGQCLAGRPCERFSEIVGEIIDWLQYDYYIGQLTNWQMEHYIDEFKEQYRSFTGIDITSDRERDQLYCRAFTIKKLKEVYDYVITETKHTELSYEELCAGYQSILDAHERGWMKQIDADFIKQAYGFVKDLAKWMDKTGFPENFPVSASPGTNKALQDIVDQMDLNDTDSFYLIRGMLTELLPLGPQNEWEVDWENRTTVEQVTDWMSESNNIFTYAGVIKENLNNYLSIDTVKRSYDTLQLVQHSHDKVLLYIEALQIFYKTNFLRLDTSDCPELPNDENNVPY